MTDTRNRDEDAVGTPVTRRDYLKMAGALAALGIALGIPTPAGAATSSSRLLVKWYEGRELLHTFEVPDGLAERVFLGPSRITLRYYKHNVGETLDLGRYPLPRELVDRIEQMQANIEIAERDGVSRS
jgi:hypothetical protein